MSEKAVLELVQRWAEIELTGDVDAYDEVLAPEFVGVGPVGFVLDRNQWAARHTDLKNHELTVTEPQVRQLGDTAIVVAVEQQRTTARGHDSSGSFRIVVVAIRRDDHWRIAHIQFSGPMIAPGQAPPFAKADN